MYLSKLVPASVGVWSVYGDSKHLFYCKETKVYYCGKKRVCVHLLAFVHLASIVIGIIMQNVQAHKSLPLVLYFLLL